MTRMWVRLSVIYTLIIIAIGIVIIMIATLFRPDFALVLERLQLTDADEVAALQLANSGILQEIIIRTTITQTLGLFFIAMLTGLVASIGSSWIITRPLTTLDNAIRRVGTQDFHTPVAIKGSYEVANLSESFNQMLIELQAAENRRQNLLADVSHELRTPLTILQGNLRGALDDIYTLDQAQIANLYNQIRQLNHLIDDLHDVAQAEANRLKLTMMGLDLAQIVAQVAELFTPLAQESDLQIMTDIAQSLPVFRGDRKRIMQVLQNLIANALRYAQSTITIKLVYQADNIILSITDDGIGIPQAELAHIFDRFYRVDTSRTRETGGTGLGLAIVQSIIKAHDGTITVQSQINHGTTFTIVLPVISSELK